MLIWRASVGTIQGASLLGCASGCFAKLEAVRQPWVKLSWARSKTDFSGVLASGIQKKGYDVKWLYELIYRFEIPAWDLGPRKEFVDIVKNGRLQPCRAVCLGSGTVNNAIFLAQEGFDVTGIDYAQSAIELGRKRAEKAEFT